jgi:hypothetical protein
MRPPPGEQINPLQERPREVSKSAESLFERIDRTMGLLASGSGFAVPGQKNRTPG